MKKSKLALIISIAASITALAAVIATLLIVRDKKRKDEEELERYLDCSIQ